MTEQPVARYGVDPYLEWVAKEGLVLHEGYALDLFSLSLGPWPRVGAKGAAVHFKGRGDFTSMFLMELPPGGATAPLRHIYEDVHYVLEGSGSTQIEMPDGSKRSFEWQQGSLFSLPLNIKHRHFNGSSDRALLVTTTNMPLVMNTFFSEDLIFNTTKDFPERFSREGHFSGEGDLVLVRPGNHMWETNFIPDLWAVKLHTWDDRGPGSANVMFVLANGLMHAHVSEMPVGVYKKAHRHGPGTHVMSLRGEGYSLMWHPGDKDFTRVDWKHGLVFPPADQQFHQHFNTSRSPARYLAMAVGGMRYPLTAINRRGFLGDGEKGAASISVKEGGDQIEYEDQDPRIHRTFLDELRKNDVACRMKVSVAQ